MSDRKAYFTHNDYEITGREVAYQGVFRLARYHLRHRLFQGGWSEEVTREILERSSAVGILPYDPILDQVALIEQFRVGTIANPSSPWVIEIIAGCIGYNESPEQVAYREANEEAACLIETLYPIYDYFVSPGGSNEYMHLFCGKINASAIGGIHGLIEESENIRAFTVSTEEALDMLRLGQIKTAPAIVALQWLQLNRDWLRSLWQK
jgi:ADP-ribose pyrophosphatase